MTSSQLLKTKVNAVASLAYPNEFFLTIEQRVSFVYTAIYHADCMTTNKHYLTLRLNSRSMLVNTRAVHCLQ
jgi:hypothetical protein